MYTHYAIRRAIARGNRLARELKQTRATSDKSSYEFWRLLSGDVLPVEISIRFYEKAGYKPLSGWPLTIS